MPPEDNPAEDDPHGECRHEIGRLNSLNAILLSRLILASGRLIDIATATDLDVVACRNKAKRTHQEIQDAITLAEKDQ